MNQTQVLAGITCQVCNSLIPSESDRNYFIFSVCKSCRSYGFDLGLVKHLRYGYCLSCGELIIQSGCGKVEYCPEHHNTSEKKKRAILFRRNKKRLRERHFESLGTFDTWGKYEQYPTHKLARRKDGTPDFEKERMLVRHLHFITFNKPQSVPYNPTEGDAIRGLSPKE